MRLSALVMAFQRHHFLSFLNRMFRKFVCHSDVIIRRMSSHKVSSVCQVVNEILFSISYFSMYSFDGASLIVKEK